MSFAARLGAEVTQRFHGRSRTAEGFLILRERYVFPDQESAIGWCYLGLTGMPLFLGCCWYIVASYGYVKKGTTHPQAHFASWSAMPGDVRVLAIVAILAWAAAFVAMVRLFILNIAIKEQSLPDLE